MSVLRTRPFKLAVAAIVVLLVAGVALYYRQQPAVTQPEGITLTIITRHDTTIWEAYEKPFLASELAKKNNIVAIRWIQPDPGLWKQVLQKGDPRVDVAWGGGPTLFDLLVRENLLDPIDDPETSKIVAAINETIGGAAMKRRDSQGRVMWVAAAISSFGFTVNQAFLRKNNLPAPQKWEDLASVDYARLLPTAVVSMGNAPQTTSNTRIYEIILQAFGWEKGWSILIRMGANARIYSGSVETQQAVEIGETGVGMSIDFYGYTTQLRNPQTEYVLPLGQSIINGDPIALVKNAKNKAAAQSFIAFVLSPEGQALWLGDRVNRMPVRGEAFKTELGKKRADLERVYQRTVRNIGIPFDDDLALSYETAVQLYFQAVITDAHTELVRAWKAVTEAKFAGKVTDRQFDELVTKLTGPVKWAEDGRTPQFTREYAQSVNERLQRDPAFANRMLSIWRQAAIQQYDAVMQLLAQLTM